MHIRVRALNKAAEEAGAPAIAGEVHATVAAARAAARNAMESLRRDEIGLGAEGGRDVLTRRQVSWMSVDPHWLRCGTSAVSRGVFFAWAHLAGTDDAVPLVCCRATLASCVRCPTRTKYSYTPLLCFKTGG